MAWLLRHSRLWFLLISSAFGSPGDSLADLEFVLDRAVTVSGGFLSGEGDAECKEESADFAHTLDFLQQTRARFAGRSAFTWAGEASFGHKLSIFKANADLAHVSDALPELVIEACVFEVVSTQVASIAIPADVFAAIGRPVEARNFIYADMLFPDGWGKDRFGTDMSVPDFTQVETKLWFYFAATRYIDAGAEAIHFGQVGLMAREDHTREHTWSILAAVRSYAATNARRGFVLCNAHIFQQGWEFNGTLLMDFHAYPARPRDVVGDAPKATLRVDITGNCGDNSCHRGSCSIVPYRASAGGRAPGGYRVDSLPYLVELDNWGQSDSAGSHVACRDWTWGTDEIIWFGQLPRAYRRSWLSYAVAWLRAEDPRGHFQMPGLRKMQGYGCYDAHGTAFNDTAAIADVWAQQTPASNTLRAGDVLLIGKSLVSQDSNWTLTLAESGDVGLLGNDGLADWSTGTAGSGGAQLMMQWDGNLVLTTMEGAPVWSVGKSAGNPGAYLLLQNDGNLVIYQGNDQVLWSRRNGHSSLII